MRFFCHKFIDLFSRLAYCGTFLCLFLLLNYSYAQKNQIDSLNRSKKGIESEVLSLNKKYLDITSRINQLKYRKDLNLLEEAELLNLMAQAQSISNQIEERYKELDEIESELSRLGYDVGSKQSGVLKLTIPEKDALYGPSELKEKVQLLKEKEERLKKELERLIEIEKRLRLKEEANAFIKEQSLFDEDSVLSAVKKNVKGVANSTATLPDGDKKEGRGGITTEAGYDSNSTLSNPSTQGGGSSQNVRIKVEVSYEKSGFINQMNVGKGQSYIVDIDLNNTNPEELAKNIEMLKKIYEELVVKRVEVERRALEVERIFKEKKK
ncbi:MAG: hypothetical protein ACP5QK_12035 [Myxococcota bacterium]